MEATGNYSRPIDAIRIANAFYLGEDTLLTQTDEDVTELRFLCRQHSNWTKLLSELQLQFRSILDLAFPGYDKAFQNIFNPTSLQLLTSFPSPSALITTDQEEVIDILMQNHSKLEFQLLNRKWRNSLYNLLLTIYYVQSL